MAHYTITKLEDNRVVDKEHLKATLENDLGLTTADFVLGSFEEHQCLTLFNYGGTDYGSFGTKLGRDGQGHSTTCPTIRASFIPPTQTLNDSTKNREIKWSEIQIDGGNPIRVEYKYTGYGADYYNSGSTSANTVDCIYIVNPQQRVSDPRNIDMYLQGNVSYGTIKSDERFEIFLNVNVVGDSLFSGITVTNVKIPEKITSIGPRAFKDCTELSSITLPSTISGRLGSTIGSVFEGCTKLESINLEDTQITAMGINVFSGCTSLTGITFPSTFSDNIGTNCFSGCTSLQYANISGTSMTALANSAFAQCSSLTSITLPTSITNINSSCFYNSGLKEIDLSYITTIGQTAFSSCKSLSSVTFSDKLLTIGSSAFGGNTQVNAPKFTGLTFPSSLTNINNDGFKNCGALQNIVMPRMTPPTLGTQVFENVGYDGILYVPYGTDYSSWLDNSTNGLRVRRWEINNTRMITYTVNSGAIIGIDKDSEWGPGTRIVSESLDTSSGTTGILVFNSDNIYEFPGHVFANKSILTSIDFNLPNLRTVNVAAFEHCENLTKFPFERVPSLTSIANSAFAYSGLENVEILTRCTIGTSAFRNCTKLKTLSVSEGVYEIPETMCAFAASLESIFLEKNIITIKASAFSDCTALEAITCHAPTPPTLGTNAFKNVKRGGTLYVPFGSDYSSWLTNSALGTLGWTISYMS